MDQSGAPNGNVSAAAGDTSAADAEGPPVDLPDHVPDHVRQIHDLIREFLDGDRNGPLGEAIQHL